MPGAVTSISQVSFHSKTLGQARSPPHFIPGETEAESGFYEICPGSLKWALNPDLSDTGAYTLHTTLRCYKPGQGRKGRLQNTVSEALKVLCGVRDREAGTDAGNTPQRYPIILYPCQGTSLSRQKATCARVKRHVYAIPKAHYVSGPLFPSFQKLEPEKCYPAQKRRFEDRPP